jgi:Tfp pilus assembly protein PilV
MDRRFGWRIMTRKKPYGFTLVEVLVASAIVIVASLTIFGLLVQGSSLNKDMLIRRRVAQELERILENPVYSYKSPNYITLSAQAYTQIGTVIIDDLGTVGTTADDMNATQWLKVEAITYTINTISVPAKIVTAKIQWTQGGQAMAESLSTIITLVDAN